MASKRKARPERFEPDPVIPLIRTARKQIEATPGGALGWLVEFVRSDPATWLPGDVEAHGHRLLALVYGPIPETFLMIGTARIPPITPADVKAIHGELYDFFHRLVTVDVGIPVKVPTDDLDECLVRLTRQSTQTLVTASGPRAVPAMFTINRGGPRRTLLYQAVKQLVVASDRLMGCPMCGRPFLARLKKKFCSSGCLREWYDKRSKRGDA